MGIKINKPVIAFVSACAGLLAVPLSLLKSGSIGVEGAWVALVFFLIVESLALAFAWQARARILGKVTMVLAVVLILLMVGNTIRFFASESGKCAPPNGDKEFSAAQAAAE